MHKTINYLVKKNRTAKYVLLGSLSIFLISCDLFTPQTEEINISIGANEKHAKTAKLICPTGLNCNAIMDTLKYQYEDNDLYLLIALDPEIKNEGNITDHINYIIFRAKSPSLSSSNAYYYYAHYISKYYRDTWRELSNLQYSGGILSGTIVSETDRITKYIKNNCQTNPKDSCADTMARNMNVNINFHLRLDDNLTTNMVSSLN